MKGFHQGSKRWLSISLLLFACAASADKPPTESFFRYPAISRMTISPHGQFVAALGATTGSLNVVVIDLEKKSAGTITGYADPATVTGVRWKSDDRLIYTVRDYDLHRNKVSNIGAVNRDGKNHLLLFDNRNPTGTGYYSDELVDLQIDDPINVLMTSQRETPAFPIVYRTDTSALWHPMTSHAATTRYMFDTRRDKLTAAPGRNCHYLADLKGVVRACLSLETDLSRLLLYRADHDAAWETLARFTNDSGFVVPIGFTADNKRLYVLSNLGSDTRSLYEFDPATKTLGKKLFEAQGVDVTNPLYSADGRQLMGVEYSTDHNHVFYLDKNLAELHASLLRAFPADRVGIYSQSIDAKRAIINVVNDQSPGKYFLYDDVKQSVTLIADRAPWINPKEMGQVRTVKISSRDGLELNGYLTLPPGREAKNLPLIVDPHGGPYGVRDYDGWNPDTQFFATRGYAVLQINYRGSGGYGAAFQKSGKHEWGGRMQDDITDGVNWAIKQGIVDARRIAIYGVSYGGYAALMGLVLTPELYRCGISYSGVSDLEEIFEPMVRTNSLYRERSREELAFWTDAFGGRKDSAYLRERSPLYNIKKISAPVFLAHGVDDLVVPYSTATQFRDALQSAGKPVEFYSRADEGHGFEKAANNVELFNKIEQFLQKCNPAN